MVTLSPDRPPGFELLLDWLEGRLSASDAELVAAQVADGNAQVQATVNWLHGFLNVSHTVAVDNPPPIVHQSLMQYFSRWKRARAAMSEGPVELIAELVFDSRQDLAATGVRAGDNPDEVVHLAYSCDAGDLLIDVSELAGRLVLDGQVLPVDSSQAPIYAASLAGPGFAALTLDGDHLGRFCLDGVPAARCQIRVSNGEIEMVADLDLRTGVGQP